MQSLMSSWTALTIAQRMIALLAAGAVFVAVILLARGANAPNYALLFGGLEGAAAGDVITALDQQGVSYEVRGNAIYVDAAARDSLRLTLAGQGLPASGGQGYELLDSLTGFGTTAQMFDAAYWRAKEGELARTILSSPHIRSARVHISTPAGRPFQRDAATTASVTVQTVSGTLATTQVKALQFMVAAAVSGLAPEDVAIVDSEGGLLSGNDAQTPSQGGSERAEALRQQAERLLIARVGPGNAVVELSIDTVTESESISERTIDPDSRVAISTDVQENSGKSEDSRGGNVTVASNLPDGDAAGSNGTSQNESSETRALTNYEVSETQREILRGPGAIKRLTVAVLVNETVSTAPDGTITRSPRSPEELADLESLVASAVGLDTARGDILTLRSMPFEALPVLGTEASDLAGTTPLDMMQLIQIGALAVVALILGLFVVRPILTPRRSTALPPPALEGTATRLDADAGPIPVAQIGRAPNAPESADVNPVDRLRRMIAEREDETIQILQSWVEDPPSQEKV